MLEWIKTKLIWILCILTVLSWVFTGYVLYSKGIHINKSITTISESTSYANASSSSIGINVNDSRYYGMNEKAVYKSSSFKSVDEALVFINGLPESGLYNKDMFTINGEVWIVYRTIADKDNVVKGHTFVKTVNGKVVEQYKK